MRFRSNYGVEDFKDLIKNKCTYVDKTRYLKELFGDEYVDDFQVSDVPVYLFLRPRRFGKTLTLSMIEHFCKMDYNNPEKQDKARELFENLEIYQDIEFCKKHMAQYPVISITLKGVNHSQFHKALKKLGTEIAKQFDYIQDHKDYAMLPRRLKDTVEFFYNFGKQIDANTDNLDKLAYYIEESLCNLSEILHILYKRKIILLIDEYDVPLHKAAINGYYDDMIEVLRNMFSQVLKTNGRFIQRAIVSGCMRICKESIFTGLNNLGVFGINDESFNAFIGFTKDDVHKLLQQTKLASRENEIYEWYDGYNFKGAWMLCPYSVLNFIGRALKSSDIENFACENYWANTSDNNVIDRFFTLNDINASAKLQDLVDGHKITIRATENISYNEILHGADFDSLMILLMHTGYVTALNSTIDTFSVKIPNKEVFYCFKERVNSFFNNKNLTWVNHALDLKDALFASDHNKAQSLIRKMLTNFISVRDYGVEGNYHVFLSTVLSMCSNPEFKVESNQESGHGYYDLSLTDRMLKISVIIETKKLSADASDKAIDSAGNKALEQIKSKDYSAKSRDLGYKVIAYGIVFYGKGCRVFSS